MLNFNWKYDQRTDTYIFGKSNHGGGVFKDNNMWYGNSVVYDNILFFDNFTTKEEAQKKIEKDFIKRIKEN
jgi:hypothetical protein